MTPRLIMVSKIARIIDHQKEVIEFQVREISHRRTLEAERLSILENELKDNLDRFVERSNNRNILNSEEVTYLFGMTSTIIHRMERKKREINKIEKELEAQLGIFLEAYKKKKAIEIVRNKIGAQERRAETVLEQKNMDYLNLSTRTKQ
jgi:hypothetical protein